MTSDSESKQRLYRIVDFSRAVQVFERRELYFTSPGAWDDPYENRILHAKSGNLFSQCWCQSGMSDAMWRIYSQNGLGVRLSTTAGKLMAAVRNAASVNGYRCRGRKVEYLPQRDLNRKAGAIAAALRANFEIARAVDMLYLKRDAFDHEREWRATLYCPSDSKDGPKGIAVPVDPHHLVDRVLLDPRAPVELVSALKFYFEKKLKFKGEVARSVLYKSPKPLLVEG